MIRAWGQRDIDYTAAVDRNGAINLPRVGVLNVAGLKYQDLHGFLRTAIGRVFRNFELNVTTGALRSTRIFVVGAARPRCVRPVVVTGLVRFGGQPAVVPDAVMDARLQREDAASGLHQDNRPLFSAREAIKLVDGPLAGMNGQMKSAMSRIWQGGRNEISNRTARIRRRI